MSAILPTRAYDWRRATPGAFASRTRRSLARCISLASVGKVIAFSCTVVVENHLGEVGGLGRAGAGGDGQALLQERQQPLLAEALAPARQRRALERQLVLKELLATEQLEIRVLQPTRTERLVGEIVQVLEDRQAGHQPGGQ